MLPCFTTCAATALKGSNTLTHLKLWGCNIDGTALSHLLDGICAIPTLRFLDLGLNSLGTEGAWHLSKTVWGSTLYYTFPLHSQACAS